MGFSLSMNGENVVCIQTAPTPRVYLDTWALRLLHDDRRLAVTLTDLLNARGETLMVSDIGLVEVVKRDDRDQMLGIAEAIDGMNFAFIDTNPRTVIDRETELMQNGIDLEAAMPWTARGIVEAFLLYAHDFTKSFRLSEAITKLRADLDAGYVIEDSFESSLYPRVQIARSSERERSMALRRFSNRNAKVPQDGPITEYLFSLGIDYLVVNEMMGMPNSEWRDFFQVFVPTAYCDYVLLDKRWRNFMQVSGVASPRVARVYDRREFARFLSDLEKQGVRSV